MDKIKTLSQAIRLGATFRPQCQFLMFDNGKSCALGAAAEAIGTDIETKSGSCAIDALDERFRVGGISILSSKVSLKDTSLATQISHKNDMGETREQIADWLESIGL